MLTRICVGVLGALLSFGAALMLLDGSFSSSGRYGWLMPFLGVAFIVYALGGQKLLKKYFPVWAEKEESRNLDDEKSKRN
jgi:hypothetical protein